MTTLGDTRVDLYAAQFHAWFIASRDGPVDPRSILGGVLDEPLPPQATFRHDPCKRPLDPEILVNQQPAHLPKLVQATKANAHENAHGVYFSYDPVPLQFDPKTPQPSTYKQLQGVEQY